MPVNALAPEPRNAMLRPYEPTWKEQIAAYLMGNTRPSPERRQFATGIADILGYLPGTGNVLQGQEAARAGDTKGAIMAMLPLPGANVAARAEQAIAQDVAKGIRAYHGSPHSFERFDISKIGSGEGAQSFGHGLYFAESEGVAKRYRDALSENPDFVKELLRQTGGDKEAAVKLFREYKGLDDPATRAWLNKDELANLESQANQIANPQGSMYEVSINANPEHFLDWDKPLNKQNPEVLAAFMKLPNAERKLKEHGAVRVGQLLKSGLLPESFDISGPNFSKTYNEAGIPGIKYLDQMSRGAQEGTRNYVVFDDKLVEIMRKYGLMGPIGAGIAAKILARQEQRQDM